MDEKNCDTGFASLIPHTELKSTDVWLDQDRNWVTCPENNTRIQPICTISPEY